MTLHDNEIIQYLEEFYIDQLGKASKNNTINLINDYLAACNKLQKMVPVLTHKNNQVPFDNLAETDIVVVANHIGASDFFKLRSGKFFFRTPITRESLYKQYISPTIFRHYPLVNVLVENGYCTVVVSGKPEYPLDIMTEGWGGILVEAHISDRTRYVCDEISKIDAHKKAIVIFPEAIDSADDLLRYRYELKPFKRGFAVIAGELGIPVLPISLAFSFYPLKYHMKVHEIVHISKKSDYTEDAEKVRKIIENGILEIAPKPGD